MSALSFDIGSYSIKAILADISRGGAITIKKVAEAPNNLGFVIPSDDTQAEKLAETLDTYFSDNALTRTDVRLSLPDTVVSTKVISIPPLTDAELASAIGWQAEQHIPIPPEELALEYQVLYRPNRGEKSPMRVLLVGTRKQLVERYVTIFNAIGVEPTLVETHTASILRALKFNAEDPPTLIVHTGSAGTQMIMTVYGELLFVVTNAYGGQVLSRALEQAVGLDTAQAEEYKRKYGLDESQFQGKVREALVPSVSMLVGEIKKAMQYHQNQNPTQVIQRVVLSGGSASLPGLVQHIAKEVGLEVLIASPFASATGEIPQTITPSAFTVCMGMLQRKL